MEIIKAPEGYKYEVVNDTTVRLVRNNVWERLDIGKLEWVPDSSKTDYDRKFHWSSQCNPEPLSEEHVGMNCEDYEYIITNNNGYRSIFRRKKK